MYEREENVRNAQMLENILSILEIDCGMFMHNPTLRVSIHDRKMYLLRFEIRIHSERNETMYYVLEISFFIDRYCNNMKGSDNFAIRHENIDELCSITSFRKKKIHLLRSGKTLLMSTTRGIPSLVRTYGAVTELLGGVKSTDEVFPIFIHQTRISTNSV